MRLLKFIFIWFFLICICNSNTWAQPNFKEGFSYKVICELEGVSCYCFLPDGSIILGKQNGEVYQYKDGELSENPILDIPSVTGEDKGLIGIEPDPNFENEPFLYVTYTLEDFSNNRVSRFPIPEVHHSDGHGGEFRHGHAEDEEVLLDLSPLVGSWHVGGAIQFDKEGHLFVTIGDNSHPDNSQDENTYHGKVLRLFKDGAIPQDNPFYGQGHVMDKVWALGLRNPYTSAYDTLRDRFFINDVGLDKFEEINDASLPGENFGWPYYEGADNGDENYTDPLYSYERNLNRTDTTGTALTGGCFYNAKGVYPAEYEGMYFFSDFESKWINYLNPDNPSEREVFASNLPRGNVYLKVGQDGFLYFFSRVANKLFRIEYYEPNAPVITQSPIAQNKIIGNATLFEVSASGENPLVYQWYKDGLEIGGGLSRLKFGNTQFSHEAKYHVKVSNGQGSVYSDTVQLNVFAEEVIPRVNILSPSVDTLYRAGDTIKFVGQAFNSSDELIDESKYKWILDFHHDEHVHDQLPILVGQDSGFYVLPTIGEIDYNVYFNLIFSVMNDEGFQAETNRIFNPVLSTITLETEPDGLSLRIDGSLQTSPYSEKFVQGLELSVSIDSMQSMSTNNFEFVNWSHGAEANHVIQIPESNVTYSAVFQNCKEPPTEPQNIEVDTVSSNIIGFKWDKVFCEDSILILRFDGDSFNIVDVLAKDTQAYIDSNLQVGTSYFYKLQSINQYDSTDSEIFNASTNKALFPVSSLTATAFSYFRVNLSWEDTNEFEDSYELQRSVSSDFEEYTQVDLPADSKTYVDIDLNGNTDYYYRLISKGEDLEFKTSETVKVRTLEAGCIEVPSLPIIKESDLQGEGLQLSWELDECAESIVIEKLVDSEFEVLDSIAADSDHYLDVDISNQSVLYYRLRFVNRSGYSDYAETIKRRLLPVSNFSAQVFSHFRIDLNWEDHNLFEDSYHLQRSFSSDFEEYIQVDLAADSKTYVDLELDGNTDYYYRLMAVGDGLDTIRSKVLNVKTFEAGCIEVPSLPIIKGSDLQGEGLQLSWELDECAESIVIEKLIDSEFEVLDSIAADSDHYLDVDISNQSVLYYRLRFVNRSGYSDYVESINYQTILSNDIESLFSDLNIFPNPANEAIVISHTDHFVFTLMDIEGKVLNVPEEILDKNIIKLDIESLKQGIYLLLITTESDSILKKIVVKRK
ncbi:MAG: PQQ-dependent sugar dehydrogenase [Cyclobacteriaceae bacterium]